MCGLAGYIGFDPDGQALSQVRRLLTALAHRGPDDRGLVRYEHRPGQSPESVDPEIAGSSRPSGSPVAVLGCCRLAILDRSPAGHQPMASADGRFVLILNGEIYNYVELRRELVARGRHFRSGSDTEVLLAAFEEWGQECLHRLVGMYAFAVLDTVAGNLFVARDCFGIKPLYLARRPGGWAFASEIAPLLAWPGVSRRVSPQPLFNYLSRGVVDLDDDTLFTDVAAVPPAHYSRISLRSPFDLTSACYWRPDLSRELELSFDEATERFRELFLESIGLHLRSDVPVGALLSGGTDSSSVVMAMRELGGPTLDLHTFSYIGGHGAPSEERWIDIVNRAARATPHKVRLEPGEWSADLAALAQSQDEPFGSLAVYAQARLFRRARTEGVPVVLSGQGADELLGGYEDFWPGFLASLLRAGSLGPALRFLRATAGPRAAPGPAAARSLLRAIRLLLPAWLQAEVERRRQRLPWVSESWSRKHAVRFRCWPARGPRVLQDRLIYRLTAGLPDLLRYEDRSSMAASVEARVPFLTRDLATFVLALPAHYVMGVRGQTKHVLRESMRGIVPDEILDRTHKVGFAVPLQSWPAMTPDFRVLMDWVRQVPAVNVAAFEQPLRDLLTGRPVPATPLFGLWRLAGLGAWVRALEPVFE